MKSYPNAAKTQLSHTVATVLRDLTAIFLVFAGLALIAAGLWHIWPPVALIFVGAASVYLGWCVHLTAKYPERTDKK